MISGLLTVLVLFGWGQWVSTGPEGGSISATVQSVSNASELWALSGSNPTLVVHSTDGGDNWETLATFTSGTPYDMVITADGSLIAVGSGRSWTSTDNGQTWTSHSFTNTTFYDAVAHPDNAGELFATGYKYDNGWKSAFMHSTNNGATFSVVYLPITGTDNSYGRSIAVSESSPSTLLVGGYKSTTSGYVPFVFRTIDGGSNFTEVTPAAASAEYYFYGVAVHPTSPNIMLTGSLYSVYRSTNGGNSWTKVQTQYYNLGMVFSQPNNNLVFAGGSYKIYRSADGGSTWSSITAGLSGSDINHIVPNWNNSSEAYTSSSEGFFKSTDGGVSWAASNSGLTVGKVLAMAESQGWMFMNMEDMGLFKSQTGSGSVNWEEVSTPLSCGDFCDICADNAGILLALEGSG